MKGLCAEGRLADAFAMLSQVSTANIRTFHTLLRGAVREADGAFAQKMYSLLLQRALKFTFYFSTVESICWNLNAPSPSCSSNDFVSIISFAAMESSSVSSDAVAFEYLIKALSYSMQIDDAWKMLLQLTEAYVND